MAVEVEELILQPFRDVVERAKEAVENAEAGKQDEPEVAKVMLRSARTLVREGERALQRLQPLWDGRLAQYGHAFTEAIGNDDGILEKQRTLEDLLYDLDDFVELDTFDAERFSEVQAASKAFALNLLESIKRLRIEKPAPTSDILTPASPTTTWSHVPKLLQPSITSRGRSEPPSCALPPTPGMVDGHCRRPSSPDILGVGRESIRLVSQPTSPVAGPGSPNGVVIPLPENPWISEWVNEQTTTTSWPQKNSKQENTIPENEIAISQGVLVNRLDGLTLQGSTRTTNHSLSPETTGTRASLYTESAYSTPDSYFSTPRTSAMIPSSDTRTTSLGRGTATSHTNPGIAATLPPPPPSVPEGSFATGLILANESAIDVSYRGSTRSMLNRQMGVESALYQLDGFCSGALAFRNQGYQAATKGAMEYGTSGSVARCVDCEFRHSLAELELDMSRDSSGNWCKAEVLYRLRFVYKSHMKVESAHTVHYGCLFCVQQGHTVHEADATVFTREEQLFQHLARHPHPLPDVGGVTVLYGKIDKDNPLIEDYDLHFPGSPATSPYPDETVLARLPAAVTVKNHERKYGSRPLIDPDGSKDDVLQFFAGSRIVGIRFPESWKGKWCMGWHEGILGSFPASLIAIEPPEFPPDISNSGLAATTRWTWDKRDFKNTDAGWLSFGLYETIYNITWIQESDWCWAGMTRKGKVGLFPRSHINPDSIRREPGPSLTIAHGGQKYGSSLGLMRKFTVQSSGS